VQKIVIFFFTGNYDQHVRLWNKNGDCLFSIHAHSAPITSLSCTSPDSNNNVTLISASQDHSAKMWQVKLSSEGYNVKDNCVLFQGHTDSITSTSLNPSSTHFCSGGYDKSINIWSLTNEENSSLIEEEEEKEKDQNSFPKKKEK